MLAVKRRVPAFLNVPWSISGIFLFVAGWFGLQSLLLIGVASLASVWPMADHIMSMLRVGNVEVIFAFTLLDAAVGFGLIWLYLRKYHVGWKAVGWRRVSVARTIVYLLGIFVFFILASNLILWLGDIFFSGFDANEAQNNELIRAAKTHFNLALIALVLLPPILEETIFRGFIFPAIAKKTGIIWGAILSSVIFGIAHWQPNTGIYTLILGLLLCFMYVRLRSIVPGILLHMLNNFLALLSTLILPS